MNGIAIKSAILGTVGVIGSVIAQLFGGWTTDLETLLICMLIDCLTGIAVAAWFKKSPKTESGTLSSNVGVKGLFKKIAMLFCVMLAQRIDLTLGTEYIRTAATIAFIVNELLSIIENTGLMGVQWPPVMLKAIDVLKQKGDENK